MGGPICEHIYTSPERGQDGQRPSEHQKCDADGNLIDKSNKNSILDTHLYQVEFPGGEMTELVVNIITESIYVQCDVDGNEYLLLETFVYH